MSFGAGDAVQLPLAGETFQLVRPAFLELDSRASDEVFDGSGDEDFAWGGFRGHASSGVDRDTGRLVAHEFALAGVQPAPKLDSERAHGVADRARTPDCARRAVEAREEAVAGGVDLSPAKTRELATPEGVVLSEQVAPPAVAELCGPAR